MRCPGAPLVFLVAALSVAPASAQVAEPGTSSPAWISGDVDRVLGAETTAPPRTLHEPDQPGPFALRLVLAGGLGLLVEVGALLGGYSLANAVCGVSFDCSNPIAFTIMLTPALLLMPLTVWGVNGLLGGQAAYWPALLGGLAGALFAAALIPTGNERLLPVGLALPVAGALVGYEIQHRQRGAPRALPFVVPGGGGGLAIAGAF